MYRSVMCIVSSVFIVPSGFLGNILQEGTGQPGKDSRAGHRYRVNLPALVSYEPWRWREICYRPEGFEVR